MRDVPNVSVSRASNHKYLCWIHTVHGSKIWDRIKMNYTRSGYQMDLVKVVNNAMHRVEYRPIGIIFPAPMLIHQVKHGRVLKRHLWSRKVLTTTCIVQVDVYTNTSMYCSKSCRGIIHATNIWNTVLTKNQNRVFCRWYFTWFLLRNIRFAKSIIKVTSHSHQANLGKWWCSYWMNTIPNRQDRHVNSWFAFCTRKNQWIGLVCLRQCSSLCEL